MTLPRTSPEWHEIRRLDEKRLKASNEHRKGLGEQAIHEEAMKLLDQKHDEST